MAANPDSSSTTVNPDTNMADPEGDSNLEAMANTKEVQGLLKRFEEQLKEAPEKLLRTPNMSVRMLRNVKQFLKTLTECEDNEAALDLMYQNQMIPLGQTPAPTDVYLQDYEEKLSILTFIANTSFVQTKGRRANRIANTLISRFVWAAIWVAPVEIMREWKETIDNDEPLSFNHMLFELHIALPQLVKYWRAKETGNSKGIPAREEPPKQAALQRDKGRCVLLKSQDPQVAHIYPHASILNASHCARQSIALANIWGDDIIEEFMEQMGLDHIDVPQNLISLSCQVHFWMDQFKVALEPIEEGSNDYQLFVRFRYLRESSLRPKKGRKSRFETGGLELNQDPKEFLEALRVSSGELLGFEICNAQTRELIQDGHLFAIRTDDPILRPLPSIRIMQVYCRMALVISLAGAVEEDDDTQRDRCAMDLQSDTFDSDAEL